MTNDKYQMKPFNQLLNEYIQRSGISDTELAREVGVSRQTIFRWREGLTARPRYREDVLVIGRKLRLTAAERDQLLLAAGFRPEETPGGGETGETGGLFQTETTPEKQPEGMRQEFSPSAAVPEASQGKNNKPSTSPASPAIASAARLAKVGESARELVLRRREEQLQAAATGAKVRERSGRRNWLIIAGGGLLVLVVMAALGYGWSLLDQSPPVATGVASNDPNPPLASPSGPVSTEPTTILVAYFANYAGGQVGYNVAGRLAEALQQEIDALRLAETRLEIWPEPVAGREEALRAGRDRAATLVIYGEYDVGRVVVKFAHPADQTIFADPALSRHVVALEDLSTAINTDLPRQVRSLALIALGQIHLKQDAPEQALIFLGQARDHLRNDPAIETRTWAVVNFFLGTAYHNSAPPRLDEALVAYGEAIDRWPEMVSSRLNRIAAYEARNGPGDLDRALADADALVEAAPEWGLAYNNRASIRLTMGGPENLALALDDLDRTLALEPELPEAHLNRAIVLFGLGRPVAEILPDVDRALALRPDYGSALNLLCWGYGLEGQPEQALPYCRQAVEAEPDEPLFRDSRGLTLALGGDYPAAIADFESYTAWLEMDQAGDDWERDLMRRRAWIEALEAGDNPFTPQLLTILRDEVGE